MRAKPTGAVLIALLVVVSPLGAAVRGEKAMYVGGTLAVPENKQGKLDTSGENLVFTWDKDKWETSFKGISKIEYGQKAGRRVGAAIAVSPLLLFSKKRKHYVTLQLTDSAGAQQAAVFELSKGTYQAILGALEGKTGLKVEYETEETKKEK